MLDSEHGRVSKYLGQIDAMYEWEGPIAEQLEVMEEQSRAEEAGITTVTLKDVGNRKCG